MNLLKEIEERKKRKEQILLEHNKKETESSGNILKKGLASKNNFISVKSANTTFNYYDENGLDLSSNYDIAITMENISLEDILERTNIQENTFYSLLELEKDLVLYKKDNVEEYYEEYVDKEKYPNIRDVKIMINLLYKRIIEKDKYFLESTIEFYGESPIVDIYGFFLKRVNDFLDITKYEITPYNDNSTNFAKWFIDENTAKIKHLENQYRFDESLTATVINITILKIGEKDDIKTKNFQELENIIINKLIDSFSLNEKEQEKLKHKEFIFNLINLKNINKIS